MACPLGRLRGELAGGTGPDTGPVDAGPTPLGGTGPKLLGGPRSVNRLAQPGSSPATAAPMLIWACRTRSGEDMRVEGGLETRPPVGGGL